MSFDRHHGASHRSSRSLNLFGAVILAAGSLLAAGCAGLVHSSPTNPIAPSITTQPTSQTVTAGQVATFNVAAAGTAPLNYQWQKNGTAIANATSSTYTTPATSSSDNGSQFRVVVNNAVGSVTSSAATLTVNPASSLVITTSSLPNGQVSVPYSATLTASGGTTPYSWSVSSGSLPSGLTLGASTGQISGTPNQAGNFSFTIKVNDSAGGSATSNFSVTIASNTAALQITTTGLPNGTVGTSYSATLSATGGTPPYSWTVTTGQLPNGLTLSTGGMISGTPTAAGTFSFQVRVTDTAGGSASASFSITIVTAGLCGPPTYNCSRTDFGVAPLPSPPPNVGGATGANTVITDPAFSNRIVRVTDSNTDPSHPGASYNEASSLSNEINTFNTDSTLFVLNRGGNSYPFSFDPVAMQASRLYVTSNPSTNGLVISATWSPEFSYLNPQILYYLSGLQIYKLDLTSRSTPPAPQLVFDPTVTGADHSACLAGYTGHALTDLTISGDDQTFGTILGTGAQNSANIVLTYRIGHGCRIYHTDTQAVTGDWGTTGTVTTQTNYSMHNGRMSKDGNWYTITGCTVGSPCSWQVGTLNVVSCAQSNDATNCGVGHRANGYAHWANMTHSPVQEIRDFATYTAVNIPASFPTPNGASANYDTWSNADVNDTYPIGWISQETSSACGTQPWQCEIMAIAPNGSTVWRFAHTFSTGTTRFEGSISQDGRFFLWTSDWMGTLGSGRTDIFIVELR